MKKMLITVLLCGSMALGMIPAAFAAEIAPMKAVKATTVAESFTMSGNTYYRGFYTSWLGGGDYAHFNLNGKYSKLTFVFGGSGSGDRDVTLSISGDGRLLKTIEKKAHAFPKSYTVDVRGVYKLDFETSSNGWGMADVKLYY